MMHLDASHSATIVAVSIAVAILASYVGLDFARRITISEGRALVLRAGGGAVAMGVGLWSMQGAALLALSLPVEIRFGVEELLVALLLAIAAAGVAIWFLSRPRLDYALLAVAGPAVGLVVSAMYFVGMTSLHMAARVVYTPALAGLAVAVAVTEATAALWVAYTLRQGVSYGVWTRRAAGAAVMGLAIAGMHYAGVGAASFVAAAADASGGATMDPRTLFELTAMTTIVVLTIRGAGYVLDQRLLAQGQHLARLAAADAALRVSDERYQLAARATNDVIWDWDFATGEVLLNDAREQTRSTDGPRAAELISRRVEWLMSRLHPDDARRVRASLDAARQGTADVWTAEYRSEREDGSYATVVSRAYIVRASDGTALRMIGALTDVTVARQAERTLHDARDAAQAASRAKSEFLANMSHEIRTPMNGVMGMLGLALDTALTSEQREYLTTAQLSAESLLTVINDILDFSKIEAGRLELAPEPFRLRDLLGDTVRTLALRADQKGLELALNVLGDVPESLHGDASRLRQVVVNLVGNAIKFTARGEVVVTVGTVPDEPGAAPGDVTLHVTVADTGIGIAPEKQQLIFEAFSQADTSTTRTYGGTGLGLAISTQLVQLMGGRLWVESAAGAGSTFHFTVRVGRRTGAVPTPEVAQRTALIGLPVLIVDDNATNRRILEQTVQGWQMRPTLVPGGREAIDALQDAERRGAPFPLVLLDAQMPTMDGFDVAAEIHRHSALAGATVMMLSSGGKHAEVARCAALGIASYLTKPVKASHLLEAILRVLDAPAAVVPSRATAAPIVAPAARALRVLLAEDNLVNQTLTVALLKKRGHDTTVVENGRLAVDAAARGGFDVILMDVQMPEMGGFEATAAIRAREHVAGGRVPIVAMTARATTGDREQCLAAGMDAYIAKPIRPADLIALVEEWGARQTAAAAPTAPARASGALRVLDEAALLAVVGGDEQLMLEIIDLYLKESPRLLRDIRAAARDGDTRALQFSAHALKGSVGNMAAPRAYAAAMQLESLARADDLDAARAALATVEREFSALQDILTNFVPEPVR